MNWLRKFMYGRYGIDQLSLGLLVLSFLIILISRFLPRSLSILSLLSYIPLIIYAFRVFSRNIYKRQQENIKYLKIMNPVFSWFRKYFNRIKGAKTYKYFKCPNCSQELRVPRGNGNISITCPKCKTTFKGKS